MTAMLKDAFVHNLRDNCGIKLGATNRPGQWTEIRHLIAPFSIGALQISAVDRRHAGVDRVCA